MKNKLIKLFLATGMMISMTLSVSAYEKNMNLDSVLSFAESIQLDIDSIVEDTLFDISTFSQSSISPLEIAEYQNFDIADTYDSTRYVDRAYWDSIIAYPLTIINGSLTYFSDVYIGKAGSTSNSGLYMYVSPSTTTSYTTLLNNYGFYHVGWVISSQLRVVGTDAYRYDFNEYTEQGTSSLLATSLSNGVTTIMVPSLLPSDPTSRYSYGTRGTVLLRSGGSIAFGAMAEFNSPYTTAQ